MVKIKKGLVIGNFEVIKTPKPNSLSKKIEGVWIKHRKYNIKNWMPIEWVKKLIEKNEKGN